MLRFGLLFVILCLLLVSDLLPMLCLWCVNCLFLRCVSCLWVCSFVVICGYLSMLCCLTGLVLLLCCICFV